MAYRTLKGEVEESALAVTFTAFDFYDTACKKVHHFHLVCALAVAVAAGSPVSRESSFSVAVHTYNFSCDFHVEALSVIEILERTVNFFADVIGLVHFFMILFNRRISGQVIFVSSLAVR